MIDLIYSNVSSGLSVDADRRWNDRTRTTSRGINILMSSSRWYLSEMLDRHYDGWYIRDVLKKVMKTCKAFDVETTLSGRLTKKKILDNREEICRIIKKVRAA